MSITSIDKLKSYFKTGAKPTQEQFHALLDSYIHKSEDTSYILQGLAGATFMGVATPDSVPPVPTQKVFYIANEVGAYPNYGGLSVADGEIAFFTYNGSWRKITLSVLAQELGDREDIGVSQKCVTEKMTELESNTSINKDVDHKADVSIEGYYIHSVYGKTASSASRISTPIPVKKGEVVKVTTSVNSTSTAVISQCNENGNNITLIVHGGKEGIADYYAAIDFDGYIIVSCHITYYDVKIANGMVGELLLPTKESIKALMTETNKSIATLSLLQDKFANNIWKETDGVNIDNISTSEMRYYQAVRNAKIVGYGNVPISINLIWNGYADFFRVRLLAYLNGAWSEFLDTGNIANSEINPNKNEVVDVKLGTTTQYVLLSIDTSLIPIGEGKVLNKAGNNPPFIFSNTCYESQISPIVRLYPKVKLPCISFQFDDIVPEDSQIINLFDRYKAKCNFAFIANIEKIHQYASFYKELQNRGYGICSHSVDSKIFNTTNYPSYTDAIRALANSKNVLEREGFVINGFVAPSSQFYTDLKDDESQRLKFLSSVEKSYAYAFTGWGDTYNLGRQSNPCRLSRYSIESHTTEEIKTWIDGYMDADKIITLYAHSYNLGTINETCNEMFDIAKVESILQYIINKQKLGLLYFDNTDNCVKYFFDL
jgi:hypothetical protein